MRKMVRLKCVCMVRLKRACIYTRKMVRLKRACTHTRELVRLKEKQIIKKSTKIESVELKGLGGCQHL